MGILNCCEPQVPEEDIDETEKEYLFAQRPTSYKGKRNKKNQRHGYGVYYYDNGDVYDGNWINDEKHGQGVYYFSSGKVLKGYFENDSFVGTVPSKPKKTKKHESDRLDANPAKKIYMDDDGLIVSEPRLKSSSPSHRKLIDPNSRFDGLPPDQVDFMMKQEKAKKEAARKKMEKHKETVERIRAKYNIPKK